MSIVSSQITDFRHLLHDHPGVSGNEQYAHDFICAFLHTLNPTQLYAHVGGWGVVALFGDHHDRPTIAFRADTDALPIGHRCGHDGHTAILLRFAELVAKAQPKNNVMLVFQPEEETGMGAQKIIDSGILQQHNVVAIYAIHNLPGYREGQVVLNRHTFAAASSGVVYTLTGRATHASTPEKGINPALAVAEIIEAIQGLNNPQQQLDTFQQTTPICISLGDEAFGTSAGSAQLMFTLRAFTNQRMSQLMADAHAIVESAAQRHRLSLEIALREPFRATENDTDMVDRLERQLQRLQCDYTVETLPFRWSEDFANYQLYFHGAMFGIGAGENHLELHHPQYDFPDGIIDSTASLFYEIANCD